MKRCVLRAAVERESRPLKERHCGGGERREGDRAIFDGAVPGVKRGGEEVVKRRRGGH